MKGRWGGPPPPIEKSKAVRPGLQSWTWVASWHEELRACPGSGSHLHPLSPRGPWVDCFISVESVVSSVKGK